jgi:hypothetical protein
MRLLHLLRGLGPRLFLVTPLLHGCGIGNFKIWRHHVYIRFINLSGGVGVDLMAGLAGALLIFMFFCGS